NLLFYYESESSNKPSGVIFLEGCYCDRVIPDKSSRKDKDILERQNLFPLRDIELVV
ncbi:hypothetical protein M8J77_013251, partial [Diaphorina citri]